MTAFDRYSICPKCGSKDIQHEKLIAQQWSGPELDVIVRIEGLGVLKLWSAICNNCGHVETHVKGSIRKAQVKKIVKRLKNEFDEWPKKDQIKVSDLTLRFRLEEEEFFELLKEVKKEYPNFSVETIGNRKYLRKYQDFQ